MKLKSVALKWFIQFDYIYLYLNFLGSITLSEWKISCDIWAHYLIRLMFKVWFNADLSFWWDYCTHSCWCGGVCSRLANILSIHIKVNCKFFKTSLNTIPWYNLDSVTWRSYTTVTEKKILFVVSQVTNCTQIQIQTRRDTVDWLTCLFSFNKLDILKDSFCSEFDKCIFCVWDTCD